MNDEEDSDDLDEEDEDQIVDDEEFDEEDEASDSEADEEEVNLSPIETYLETFRMVTLVKITEQTSNLIS